MAVGARPFKSGRTWVRPGIQGSNPMAPGSWGRYVNVRNGPSSYPKTVQQIKIGNAGRQVAECKGKTGSDFYKCRSEKLSSVRKHG